MDPKSPDIRSEPDALASLHRDASVTLLPSDALALHRAAAGAVLGRVNPTPCLSRFLRSLLSVPGMNRRPLLLPCSCFVRPTVSAAPLRLIGLAGGGPREGRLLPCLRPSAGLSASPPPPRTTWRYTMGRDGRCSSSGEETPHAPVRCARLDGGPLMALPALRQNRCFSSSYSSVVAHSTAGFKAPAAG